MPRAMGTTVMVGAIAMFVWTNTRGGRKSITASEKQTRQQRSDVQQALEISGLKNVGNSCFINAVLQSLASLPPFQEYLETITQSARISGSGALSPRFFPGTTTAPSPFTSELLRLMKELKAKRPSYSTSARTPSPDKLRSLLRNKVGRFGKDDQQDAQELFQMVMRLVGEEAALCLNNRDGKGLMGTSNTGGAAGLADLMSKDGDDTEEDKRKALPENPLSGSLAYVRRCAECGDASTRMERFVDLSLTLPEARDVVMGHGIRRRGPVDLSTILGEFTQQQLVEDVECTRCAMRSAMDEVDEDGSELPPKRVPAHMHMLLGQAPQTLCLHFPRRHQSPSGREMKLEQHVNFPLRLDITPFSFIGGHHTESIGVPTALQLHATLASSLPQLPTRRMTKANGIPGVAAEALSSSPSGTSPTIAKALQSPQPNPGGKGPIFGGSAEGALAGAGAWDGSRKVLNRLPNGAGSVGGGGPEGTPGVIRRRAWTDGGMSGYRGRDYDLGAVIVHQGSADSGHYTAFRRLESGDKTVRPRNTEVSVHGGGEERHWVDISDETVRGVSEGEVLASQAYMLFYRKRSARCEGLG